MGEMVEDLKRDPTRIQRDRALDDMKRGLLSYGLWGSLGWQDIRQRYRRSAIGPFWITNERTKDSLSRSEPVISIHTKKKKRVAPCKNNGTTWRYKGVPGKVHSVVDSEMERANPLWHLRSGEGCGVRQSRDRS